MPDGETGETVAVVGIAPGTGDGGEDLVGTVAVGLGVEGEGFACCFSFTDEEKIAAVTADPAKAEAAAMRARVVLDILDRVRGGGARNFADLSQNLYDG
jgi:hypothetical protein